MESVLLDAAGRRRSRATLPGYHRGRPPRNKGLRYPADPPTVEEIVAVMRRAGDRATAMSRCATHVGAVEEARACCSSDKPTEVGR